MTIPAVDVIVVGAGMTGLTLANLLARQGKSLAIIDPILPPRFDATQPLHARVTAVSPGSRAIFEHVKAWSGMKEKRVTEFNAMVVWDEASEAKINFNAQDFCNSSLGYIVENKVIQSSLHEALHDVSGIRWYVPGSVGRVVNRDHEIEVTLNDNQVLNAKLLVGADGSRSVVRHLAEIPYVEMPYRQQGIVASIQTELPHQRTAWQRFLKTGPLALLPAGNQHEQDECSIVWSADHEYATRLMQMEKHEFEQALTEASGLQLGNVTLKSERASFPLVSGQAKEMVRPRIALAGDAAHTIHPLAGQGANLGFTDVAVLANLLDDMQRDIGSYRVLRKYERARTGEIRVMRHAMDAFATVFGSTLWPVIAARSTALNAADHMLPLKRFFMRHAMGLNSDRPKFAR
ncbi:MAG: UbiH/UbiF/VisC/COQ6 family ubiquinone biosynthesis hydroxylase [Gammaproteobacteria bacterium]|nr:UbiH/UbiF/VisC/COQ6 family ubiquinone biosynthesis hydroxylase [Gammaproteobacteria bacterium]